MKYNFVVPSEVEAINEALELIELIKANDVNLTKTGRLIVKAKKTVEALEARIEEIKRKDEEQLELALGAETVDETETQALNTQQSNDNTDSRTFAYCRVSTTEQTTANQIQAIRSMGFDVRDSRVIEETISGSTKAMDRPEFKKLIEHKLEAGDRLIVLKLDRLGRDSIDVQQTVEGLIKRGINITCLDLPVPDLSSSQGKMMLQIFMSFAEFERNRIIERTQEGLKRAVAEGKTLGRPKDSSRMKKRTKEVQECKEEGLSQSQTARRLGIGIATVKAHWNKQY